MTPEDFQSVAAYLPETVDLNHYPDRQSAWLLAHQMPETARVAELRAGPLAKLLDRPAVKPLVARSGGVLRRVDAQALAYADAFDRFDGVGPAGEAALEAAWSAHWMDFQLSFASWGTHRHLWQHHQVSRPGGNLVIQMAFPSDHQRLMGQYLPDGAREKFEEAQHPTRKDGRPTLAWSRVDIDWDRGEALIEEVQGDWLRFVDDEVRWMAESNPRLRELRAHQAYQRALVAQYAKVWPEAMLLATLVVIRDVLGLRRVWMHQPESGAVFKGIRRALPPRSLYTRLPKRFCFAPSQDVPDMLGAKRGCRRLRPQNQRLKTVRGLARAGRPVMWRLDL